MSRGPLPDPERRRRNSPTIPTTDLPISGRKDDPPDVPEGYELGLAGGTWWQWAWRLPQACAWDDGSLYAVARRARLEDDLLALEDAGHLSSVLDDMLAEAVTTDSPLELKNRLRSLGMTFQRLKRLAGGSTSIMKEMRELDKRLGLDPKAIPELRWKFVDDGEEAPAPESTSKPEKKKGGSRRSRLSVVK
jgi:hypothetical protein